MRKTNTIRVAAATSATAGLAAPAMASSIDQTIDAAVGTITGPFVSFIFSPFPGTTFPWIVLWLVIAALIFTVYFGFIQFRACGHALALVSGKYSDPKDAGEVSHFQALATALSGTVGLGNITGVAVAVGIGGAGATFWMILAGVLGMATKFCECTLGVKYRNEHPDGTVSGGPMYYLSKGLAEQGWAKTGKVMAVMFAIFCVLASFGGANMFQANQVHAQMTVITGNYPGWISGVVMAVVVFSVIVGGLKSIARVSEKTVPFICVLYCGAALVIILMNYDRIGWAFGQIWDGAFTGLGVAGGFVGALIQGFRRATFSNEAGVGSAAIAHSAVKTKEPITEGLVALLEPFIDTVVICTMTALVLILSGVLHTDPTTGLYIWNAEANRIATEGNTIGVQLTSVAFAKAIPWFPYVLVLSVIMLAVTTMISWSYYGLKAWTYVFGESAVSAMTYKVIFCIFIVIGAAINLGAVIDFSDAVLFSMAVVNIIGLYVLMPGVKRDLHSYMSRLESGEIRHFKGHLQSEAAASGSMNRG